MTVKYHIIKKSGIILSCFLLLGSATISPIAYANESHRLVRVRTNQARQFEQEKEQILQAIINDVGQSLPEARAINPYEERAAWGIFATLVAKYGSYYVRNQLPRIIYAHAARYIGRYITEAAFVRAFGWAVSNLTGFAIEGAIARLLMNWGVPAGVATPAAWVIVQVAKWYL